MNLNKNHIIIFLGPPGSGKGSLSKLCVDRLGWAQFSTGDLLRIHITNKTNLGKKIDFIIKSGKLISDALISDMVKDWLLKEMLAKSVVILDGFPRTKNQALALNKILKSTNLNKSDLIVVKLEISDDALILRLLSRVICQNIKCQAVYSLNKELGLASEQDNICSLCSSPLIKRSDDELNSIIDRLKIYHQHEHEILEVFKNSGIKVIDLNADNPIEVVYKNLVTKLNI